MMIDYIRDTIYSLITLSGGAVCIIRISGDNALNAINFLAPSLKKLEPNRISLANFYDDENNFIDSGLISYFKNPHSFTGEDVIELSLHGSIYIIDKICLELSKIPLFRLAKPGEFTKRAYYNNKMDLVQAEAVNALVKSSSKADHYMASGALKGKTSSIYNAWREKVISLMALMETSIDFSDENLPDSIFLEMSLTLEKLLNGISGHLAQSHINEKHAQGLKISIIGPPNSGKSTLINALSRKEIAIVSDIAGTTRDIITANLVINNYHFSLDDTAGIRNTNDLLEKEGIMRSVASSNNCDCRLLTFSVKDIIKDQTDLIADNQVHLLSNIISGFISSNSLKFLGSHDIIILNKVDALNAIELQAINRYKERLCHDYPSIDIILLSLTTKEGFNNLLTIIEKKLALLYPFKEEAIPSLLNQRQQKIAAEIITILKQVNLNNTAIEIEAYKLSLVNNLLGEMVGKIANEEILNSIFSSFCIGK